MLAIGARYFEFRPAHLHKDVLPFSGLQDKLYYQHACVPGMAFDEFLRDCLRFLVKHLSEIIVVQVRFDGVLAGCALPTLGELHTVMNQVMVDFADTLAYGGLDDMKSLTVEELRHQQKRLIIFPPTDVLSTYSDTANATLDGDSIMSAFHKLEPDQQIGKAMTCLHCQAAASSIEDVLIQSVTSPKASTACLLATKPLCDIQTLPWIRDHALKRLSLEELIVVLNDFIDGATVDVAITLSKERLNA